MSSNRLSIPILIYSTLCHTYEELSTALSEHAIDGDKFNLAEIFHKKFRMFPLLSSEFY